MLINPYINFNGNCAEAFAVYEKVLGGNIVALFKYSDMPGGENMPGFNPNFVGHARLVVGDNVLMGSDSPAEHFQPQQGSYVSITVDEPAEADRIYNAFAEGGTIKMPIEETFWALRFGMLVDRFGTQWMINCEKPNIGRP